MKAPEQAEVDLSAKLDIPDFGFGLKSQEPGAGKFHRNLVLVPEETPAY
jgi:hypothetical protein